MVKAEGTSSRGHDQASRRRPRSPAAQRLVDVTIATIDSGGEGAVRVQEIVEAAGAQIPVLYRNFGSREGLLQAAQVEILRRALEADLRMIGEAVDRVSTAAEFRALVDWILALSVDPSRSNGRWRRVNVLGSTYGRPQLAADVADVQRSALAGIAAIFARPQREGWVRADLDLVAFAAWFGGQTLGRLIIEIGHSDVAPAAWDSISADAVRFVLFGDTGAAGPAAG